MPTVKSDLITKHSDDHYFPFPPAGYTQIRELSREVVEELLPRCVPQSRVHGDTVKWTPGTNGHPPATWLHEVWK